MSPIKNELFQACLNGDSKLVKELKESGSNINAIDE